MNEDGRIVSLPSSFVLHPAALPLRPLTLTLSPEYGGEGMALHFFNSNSAVTG